ncbi:MAG TPA: acyl carrier protein [Solirubrobacteraceae bacterium]|nr:acyl carrier protein [Solirubrobacteraceae bacterium]
MDVDQEVLADVIELLTELAGDWEHDGAIAPQTSFLGDLGLESLDLVVIGTTVQQRYGRLPFAEYLAEIGQRPVEERDLTVGDLVDFICRFRHAAVVGGSS